MPTTTMNSEPKFYGCQGWTDNFPYRMETMIIITVLAFLAGLTIGLLYHRVAAQDWQRELDKADEGCGFWQLESLELVRYNALLEQHIRELKQALGEQPRVGIDASVGFVWVERK